MPHQIPPSPPDLLSGDDPVQRVHFRLWQISMSALTLLVTIWCFTISPILGIVVSFLAKHVLVAILATGLTPLQTKQP
ncbi:MAG: hypothetical protein NZO58_06635 [Gemmataceae bacterium]|nr:hypothetical protein [Gemmataceae bacterium]